MLSKYAHLKGFDLSNILICHSMVFFNPLTYTLYPLTDYPLTKFLNPLTKNFSRFARFIMFWGSFQNSIRLCVLCSKGRTTCSTYFWYMLNNLYIILNILFIINFIVSFDQSAPMATTCNSTQTHHYSHYHCAHSCEFNYTPSLLYYHYIFALYSISSYISSQIYIQ